MKIVSTELLEISQSKVLLHTDLLKNINITAEIMKIFNFGKFKRLDESQPEPYDLRAISCPIYFL